MSSFYSVSNDVFVNISQRVVIINPNKETLQDITKIFPQIEKTSLSQSLTLYVLKASRDDIFLLAYEKQIVISVFNATTELELIEKLQTIPYLVIRYSRRESLEYNDSDKDEVDVELALVNHMHTAVASRIANEEGDLCPFSLDQYYAMFESSPLDHMYYRMSQSKLHSTLVQHLCKKLFDRDVETASFILVEDLKSVLAPHDVIPVDFKSINRRYLHVMNDRFTRAKKPLLMIVNCPYHKFDPSVDKEIISSYIDKSSPEPLDINYLFKIRSSVGSVYLMYTSRLATQELYIDNGLIASMQTSLSLMRDIDRVNQLVMSVECPSQEIEKIVSMPEVNPLLSRIYLTFLKDILRSGSADLITKYMCPAFQIAINHPDLPDKYETINCVLDIFFLIYVTTMTLTKRYTKEDLFRTWKPLFTYQDLIPCLSFTTSGKACASIIGQYLHDFVRHQSPSCLIMQNIYYEYAESLQHSFPDFNIILSGDESTFREKIESPDLPVFDLIFVDFSWSLNLTQKSYWKINPQSIIEQLWANKKLSHGALIVVDISINSMFSEHVKYFMTWCAPFIRGGRVRVILLSSLQKLIQFGCDIASGGVVALYDINNRQKDRCRINNFNLTAFTIFAQHPHLIDEYVKTIHKNNKELYEFIQDKCNFILTKQAGDFETTFVDLHDTGKVKIYANMGMVEDTLQDARIDYSYRPSWGFRKLNLISIENKLRLSMGIEPPHLLDNIKNAVCTFLDKLKSQS